MRRVLYDPPNWIAHRVSSETRRMLAFWLFVGSVCLYPIFGAAVLYASWLGLIGVAGIFTGETPTEKEE